MREPALGPAETPQPLSLPAARRAVLRAPSFAGSLVAVLAFGASLTPSLLPRDWLLQGILSGLLLGIGYAVGAAIEALLRRIWPRRPRPGVRTWAVVVVLSAAAVIPLLWLAAGWQRELRQLTGAATVAWEPVPVVLMAGAVAIALLAAARAVAAAGQWLAMALARPQPGQRFRLGSAPLLVGLLVALLAADGTGLAAVGVAQVQQARAGLVAGAGSLELTRPESRYRSGGAGSLVAWQTLGGQGQEFAAAAVPEAELAEFAAAGGGPTRVREPIRVYVGLDSAPDPAARAELAVAELARTGALDRQVVAVVTTTGSGWVNPVAAQSLEYLYHGDTAVVAVQYSQLPSWVSFLAERRAAAESAAVTITAIRRWLDQRPAEVRPQFVVYGESLGAHGTESAFDDLTGLLDTVDGALLAGGPHSSPIRGELVAEREPGSPVWRPSFGTGVPVRFLPGDEPGAEPRRAAAEARVVYLQNVTDPVVWWRPSLLYQRPDWLAEPRYPGRSAAARWLPVVTFWQVTVDLLSATAQPDGHGHSYRESVVDGWVGLLAPPGWTVADTERLRGQVG